MPIDPDELEEIKRLISSDYTESKPSAGQPAPEQPELADPKAPQATGTGKQTPGLPAVRQGPGPHQTRQSSGPPAVRPKPGTLQTKPPPGVPAAPKKPESNRSDVPEVRKTPADTGTSAPTGPQKLATIRSNLPETKQKSVSIRLSDSELPDSAGKRGLVRRYNISSEDESAERVGKQQEIDKGPADFKLNFDFDGVYRDMPEKKPIHLRRERRTGCVGGILYAIFVICVSIVLAALAWLAASDVMGLSMVDEDVNVTVEKGFVMEDIVDMLYEAGLIRYKFLFQIYADYSKAEDKISAGLYVLNKNYDYRAIVHGMTERGGVLVETTVTIPEGFTLAEIFKRLGDYGVCTESELWETATRHNFNFSFLDRSTLGQRYRLEGFLFPDTHNFYLGSSPVQVINTLLGEFGRRFTETYVERAGEMGYSIREILTVASMIEKEAGSDEERPRIAAVIYNRLDSPDFPRLEIDATIYYAMAVTGRPYSLDINSPYNTYLHEGLPPGPISNPGIESIRAALYPETTNEYYYALNMEGTHEFFRTYEQHQAFVNSDEFGGR